MLTIQGLSKRFANHLALDSVNLSADVGNVVAIVGENGAGKSTMLRILAGAITQDSGTLMLDGRAYAPKDPAAAMAAGVAFVPQESELVPHLSVAENILLGREPVCCKVIQFARLREVAQQALRAVCSNNPIDLRQPAATLSPSDRQRVVIARALSQPNLKLLIFDEPTSSLTSADTQHLFAVIRRLRERNLTVLYVSHFLEEVLEISDRYVVLRDGKAVSQGHIADVTAAQLVASMAGTSVTAPTERTSRQRGPLLLDVRELSGANWPHSISLQLHAGEVLGIAGLVGAGRTELVRAIFGLEPVRTGQVRVKSSVGTRSPAQSLQRGLGLLSEDRRGEGLAHGLSIADNITLSKLPSRAGFVTAADQRRAAEPLMAKLQIRCRSAQQKVSELSGGNQQKVALARLLHHDVDVLLLDEPTRGIDVRSREEVHRVIDALARDGKAVLVISSYLPELMDLCDHIAVMCRGRLSAARPVADWDEHALLLEATGIT